MRPSHAVTRLALTGFGGIAALACGLSDVFRSPGLEAVTISYQGPTCIPVDSTEPFTVVVEVGGAQLLQPYLSITSTNPSVVGITSGLDSLVGKMTGQTTLTIRLESSILTDTAPTLAQSLRVRQSASNC
jgi:hypothetical protein